MQAGTTIANVKLDGLTAAEALARLTPLREQLEQTITLHIGEKQVKLEPRTLGFRWPIEEIVAQTLSAPITDSTALAPRYDAALLRQAITEVATNAALGEVTVITSTEILSRSFAIQGGQQLEQAATIATLERHLLDPQLSRSVTATLTTSLRPTPEQLAAELKTLLEPLKGVAGVYVYDLQTEQVVASFNADTVFSGASVMKVPILLYTTLEITKPTTKQQEWIRAMIIESDNLKSNNLLASAYNGTTNTESALAGARAMNSMLQELGLKHTYQNLPYEAGEFLIGVMGMNIPRGPQNEGSKPYTDADPYVRTTPAEISQIFIWIEQCTQGRGPLLEQFEQQLTPTRCRDMLALLEENKDQLRMVSGFPVGTRVAHKSGWTEDMHADVGIVRSPGGDFILAIYAYRPITNGVFTDELGSRVVGGVARLVYTFYNPKVVPLE
jgi:beta-lactamase class A